MGRIRQLIGRLVAVVAVMVGALSAVPVIAAAPNSIEVVDSARVRYTSVAMDASGNPVIAYGDETFTKLMLAHCNDPNCAPGGDSLQTVFTSGAISSPSLTLDASGFPVISFHNDTTGTLGLAHCNDVNCAGGGESIALVDNFSSTDVGESSSLVLDGSGFPVISYNDTQNGDLRVAHCQDANCAGVDIRIVDTDAELSGSSIQIDASGNPVVAYQGSPVVLVSDLRLLHCNDPICATGGDSKEVVDSTRVFAPFPSLELDASGNPVIAYQQENRELKVVHCNDVNCAGGGESFSTLDSEGQYPSLMLDGSGFPVVGYSGPDEELKVARCDDPDCSGGGESTVTVEEEEPLDVRWLSLTLDASSFPVMSYHNTALIQLKLAHCTTKSCDTSPPDVSAIVTGTKRSDGVYTSDVTVSWMVSDPETSVSTTGCGTTKITSDTNGTKLTCTATSDGGMTTESVTIVRRAPFYLMVDAIGTVYTFPEHKHVGNAPLAPGAAATDITINPEGTGYYVLDTSGIVHPIGPDTTHDGNLDIGSLKPGERPVAIALTASGDGYWIFTNLGGAAPFGDAPDIGDVSDLTLAGEIVDAAPFQDGFYLTGSDGGIFTPPLSGPSVPFYGSVPAALGPVPLAQPIVTIYVDETDGDGYSLAAEDGGMFNFQSVFCGSIPGILPGVTLNQPIVNAVPFGDCYIFFAADGGAFVFGELAFLGSLGDNPPPNPIVSGDAFGT